MAIIKKLPKGIVEQIKNHAGTHNVFVWIEPNDVGVKISKDKNTFTLIMDWKGFTSKNKLNPNTIGPKVWGNQSLLSPQALLLQNILSQMKDSLINKASKGHGSGVKGATQTNPSEPIPDQPSWIPADISKAMGMNKVPMVLATSLYQPVKSTSEGSTYFLIAVGPSARAAARIKENNVSFRVEGKISHIDALLSEVGFSKKDHHYSLHIGANTQTTQLAAVAALLHSLEPLWDHSISKISPLLGKGV